MFSLFIFKLDSQVFAKHSGNANQVFTMSSQTNGSSIFLILFKVKKLGTNYALRDAVVVYRSFFRLL